MNQSFPTPANPSAPTHRPLLRRALGWVIPLALLALLLAGRAVAQPTVLGTDAVNGTYTKYALNTVGGFRQVRLTATATASAGVRKWEFAQGTVAATDFTNNWRPYTGPLTLAGYGQVIAPVGGTASALANTGGGGTGGFLPAMTSGNQYTFNISNNGPGTNNTMAVLETFFTPATIDAVTAVPQAGGLLVTATTTGTFNFAENLYVRYSTDNFATSAVAPLVRLPLFTNANTVRRGLVPLGAVGTTVKYYVFSSTSTYTATGAAQPTGANADMLTLNVNNNGGSNYSYTNTLNVLFAENFEGLNNWNNAVGTVANLATPGYGPWAVATSNANANNLWQRNDYTTGWTSPTAGGGSFLDYYGLVGTAARFHSNTAPTGSTGDLITPTLNFAASPGNKILYFSIVNGNASGSNTILDVYLSTDGGITYGSSLATFSGQYFFFTTVSVPLGTTTSGLVKIKLTATSQAGAQDLSIDNLAVVNPVPLCGAAYTINSAVATGGTNFQTFTDAFNSLNGNGVCGSGDLTFTVSAGQTFTQAPLLLNVGGTSATNRLIFVKASGAATTLRGTGDTGTDDAVVQLNGCDWTVWDGLNFADNGTSTEYGLYLNAGSGNGLGGCQNNTVRNGAVALSVINPNLTQGIYSYSDATTAVGANSNNTFRDMVLTSSRIGYGLRGSSDANGLDQNNRITGTATLPAALTNQITSLGGGGYNVGVSYSGQQGLEISNTLMGDYTTNNYFAGVSANGGGVGLSTGLIAGCLMRNVNGGSATLYGVVANGAATSLTVRDCTFSGFTSGNPSVTIEGVKASYCGGITLTGNTMTGFSATNSAFGSVTVQGISAAGTSNTALVVSGNRISNLSAANSSNSISLTGIEIPSAGALVNAPVTLANNLIADLRANSGTSTAKIVTGLDIGGGGSSFNIYNNTVYLSGAFTSSTPVSAALWLNASLSALAPLDYRNNLLVNRSTGGTTPKAVAIYRDYNCNAVVQASTNNNLLYGTTGLCYDATTATNFTTLAAYRTYLGNNGINNLTECLAVTEATTPFVSAADAHLNTAVATQTEGGGQRLTGGSQSALAIATDVDGQPRAGETGYAGTAVRPDIGADETSATPADNTPPVIAYPPLRNTAFLTDRTLTVNILDVNGVAGGTNAPRLYYRLSGAPSYTVATASSTAIDAQGNGSYTFTLAYAAAGITPTIGQTIQYYVAARDNFSSPNAATNPAGGSGTTPPGTTAPAAPNSYTLLSALAGDYYISASTGTPDDAKRYPTLTAAVADYNAKGIMAAVRFWLFDNGAYTGETFPITLSSNPDASAIRSLTIQPYAGKTVSMTGGSSTPALLKLVDADYVTLDGSNVAGGTARNWALANPSNPGTMAVLWLQSQGNTYPNDGCQGVTIRNLSISGNAAAVAASGFGIFAGGSTLSEADVAAAGADHDNLTIENNSFGGLGLAVQARGTAQTSIGGLDNLVIRQNSIGRASGSPTGLRTGFSVSNALNYTITQNVVENVASTSTLTAIRLGETGGSANAVTRNRLVGLAPLRTAYDGSGSTDNGGQGIVVSTANTASNLLIANNMIQVSATSGGSSLAFANAGIVVGNTYSPAFTGGVKIYNNSVFLSGTYARNNQSDVSAALAIGYYAAGVEVLNNIFTNYIFNNGTGASATGHWAAFTQVSSTVFGASNYNAYDGVSGVSLNGVQVTSLTGIQSLTGKDQQSRYLTTSGFGLVPPYWTSVNDLHLRNFAAASNGLESNGLALPGTLDADFDADPRQGSAGYAGTGTKPDIGADEAETVALPAFVLNGIYTIDNTRPTDQSATGTGTRNFRSFGEAILALNAASITGNVTFNVTAGQAFTEAPPAITANGGTTTTVAPFSITFQKSGSGANPVVQAVGVPGFSTSLTYFDAVFHVLNGGDNYTFDGIDIDSPSGETEYGYLVRGTSATNGSANLLIKNTSINLGRRATDSYTNTYGVLVVQNGTLTNSVAPTTTNGRHTNIRLLNLTVTNCTQAIYVRGGTNANLGMQNVEIANCTVGSAAAPIGGTVAPAFGIFAGLVNKLSIHDNSIQYVSTASTTTDFVYGLNVNNLTGTGTEAGLIYNNAISNIATTSATNTSTSYGLWVQGNGAYRLDCYNNTIKTLRHANTGTVGAVMRGLYIGSGGNSSAFTVNAYNNVISDIRTAYTGAASTTRPVQGVYLDISSPTTTSATVNFWHNTVVINPATATTCSSTCFEISSTSGGKVDVRNNILANLTPAQTGAARHYAWVSTSASSIGNTGSVSNYNDLYSPNTNGFIGRGNVTDQTFATWKSANGEGSSSQNIDPVFDVVLKPTAAGLSGLGQQITAGLNNPAMTTDLAGVTRSNPPSMGAFEFPTGYNVALNAGAVTSPLSAYCGPGSTLTPITLTVSNPGTVPITLGPNYRLVVTGTLTLPGGATQALSFANTSGSLAASGGTLAVSAGTANLGAAGTYTLSGLTVSLQAADGTIYPETNLADNALAGSTSSTVTTSVTWTGAAGSGSVTDWFNPLNWTSGCVPTATIDVLIPTATNLPVIGSGAALAQNLTLSGTAALAMSGGTLTLSGQLVTASAASLVATGGTVSLIGNAALNIGAATFYNLNLSGSSTKILTGNVTVANNLDLTAGLLEQGNFNLTMAAGTGTVVGANASHFLVQTGSGKLFFAGLGSGGRASAFFPIGTSASSYTPVTVANSGSLDNFSARVTTGVTNVPPATDGQHYVNKQWDISEGTVGGSNATLTLQWNAADELPGFVRGTVNVGHYVGTSWTHSASGTATGSGPYAFTAGGYGSFSPFAVQDNLLPLPVELLAFSAQRQGTAVALTWRTASEKNSAHFAIERSLDGKVFEEIGLVAAQGSKASPTDYAYLDNQLTASLLHHLVYYRLLQTNRDSTAYYSLVRTVAGAADSGSAFSTAPQPFQSTLTLTIVARQANPAAPLTVCDATGRIRLRRAVPLAADSNVVELDELSGLPPGLYLLQLPVDGQVLRAKVMKE